MAVRVLGTIFGIGPGEYGKEAVMVKYMRSIPAGAVLMGTCLFILFSLGCSSSGGSSSPASPEGGSYGKVGILITDSPTDDYEHLYITITEVSLLSPDDAEEKQMVVFSDPDGYEIDLLAYQSENDQYFPLILDKEVPAGIYDKVRLKISNIRPVGGPCESMEIKLPSGKIDINKSGKFTIEPGQTIYIKIDIVADESIDDGAINLHQAGKSGKCIFRPVVFADILGAYPPSPCPKLYEGIIESLDDVDQDGFTDGFVLDRDGTSLGELNVRIAENTLIFSETGSLTGVGSLGIGRNVVVYGTFNDMGYIDALFIVIGDVIDLQGTIGMAMETPFFIGFKFQPEPGEEIAGDDVNVGLSELTIVMTPCSQTPGDDQIDEGDEATIIGRYDVQDGVLWAIAVLLSESDQGVPQ
jgi:hypothetical protein